MTLADQLQAAQVPVKPLVWGNFDDHYEAKGAARTYVVQEFALAPGLWIWIGAPAGLSFASPDLAMASAQADQDARIRAALAPDPVRAAMIEAVAALDAIAALSRVSGGTFARDYPALNRQLADEPGEHWADVLSRYADTAMDKLTAALEPK